MLGKDFDDKSENPDFAQELSFFYMKLRGDFNEATDLGTLKAQIIITFDAQMQLLQQTPLVMFL